MANKQIQEFDEATIPAATDQFIFQTLAGVTKKIQLENMHTLHAGFLNYNDLATATTPVNIVGGGGFTKLPNDTLGTVTNTSYPPTGITSVWSALNGQFDFTQLRLGDMVDIRVDVEVTTSSPNQEVAIQLVFGIGGFNYQLVVDKRSFKAAGTYNMMSYTGIFIGDANTRDNAGEVRIDSANQLDVQVNGWYIKITRG